MICRPNLGIYRLTERISLDLSRESKMRSEVSGDLISFPSHETGVDWGSESCDVGGRFAVFSSRDSEVE